MALMFHKIKKRFVNKKNNESVNSVFQNPYKYVS